MYLIVFFRHFFSFCNSDCTASAVRLPIYGRTYRNYLPKKNGDIVETEVLNLALEQFRRDLRTNTESRF